MDGAHDMGGKNLVGKNLASKKLAGTFDGPVIPEANEPLFHADWERRAFALTLAMARPGGWNIDMSRSARENRPDAEYLSLSYYEIWLAGLERLMDERGLVTAGDLAAGHAVTPPLQRPVLAADGVDAMLRQGGPSERPASAPARFSIGDRVRTRGEMPVVHTRLPAYARGHVGVIERIHGCHVFPDSNAAGHGEAPQWLYTVRFAGSELFGDKAAPNSMVSVDAWESYLEAMA